MKILVIASISPATVFALAPVSTALRNAGHQVIVMTGSQAEPAASSVGLASTIGSTREIVSYIGTDRLGRPVPPPQTASQQRTTTGEWFARLALDNVAAGEALHEQWQPDVVIGGALSYAAPLLARRWGVPYVRHAWDLIPTDDVDRAAATELAPELDELGLASLPAPDLDVTVCPPSILDQALPRQQNLRWVAGNPQGQVPGWMLSRPARPRVLLTGGSRISPRDDFGSLNFLTEAARVLASFDLELVVAAPRDVRDAIAAVAPDARVGWFPLDWALRNCSLTVHNAGGATSMTAASTGTPQLAVPSSQQAEVGARVLARAGSVDILRVGPQENFADHLTEATASALGREDLSERAVSLADEIATMPTAGSVAERIGRLAAHHRP
jgi:UDP:flavonoid glycosyltransferase YjiC (YdhE family)